MNRHDLVAEDLCRRPIFRIDADEMPATPHLSLLVAELVNRGLRVIVVRFPLREIRTKRDEDFDAVISAGGDLLFLHGETRGNRHVLADSACILSRLEELTLRYDIILVDGDCGLRLNIFQLWPNPPVVSQDDCGKVCTADNAAGMAACAEALLLRLREIWLQVPVWACVLIGGKSSRMGRPKHLIEGYRGNTWLENTVGVLRPLVEGVVLSGAGLVPQSLQDLTRVADLPGAAGPLAGILAAMRWQPEVTWVLIACDMPSLCPEAVQWLIASRRPGRWATMPRRSADSHVEPLLAHYDRRCRTLFEEIRLSGSLKIGLVARHEKIHTPLIPRGNMAAWDNINTPEELSCLVDREKSSESTRNPGI